MAGQLGRYLARLSLNLVLRSFHNYNDPPPSESESGPQGQVRNLLRQLQGPWVGKQLILHYYFMHMSRQPGLFQYMKYQYL